MSDLTRWLIAAGIALVLLGCFFLMAVANFVMVSFTLSQCRANTATLIFVSGLATILLMLVGGVAAPVAFGLKKQLLWVLGACGVFGLGFIGWMAWFNWVTHLPKC